jgi:3-oxoacyl-[acyl-carrier protein] reductase
VARWGRLDAVVHNATSRLSSKVAEIETVDDAVWDDHAAVSLRGAYYCARAALPVLSQPGGRFILMTSPAGMEGSLALPLYGVVKAGLRGFAKSLAKEWGRRGITVNCVSPLAETDALRRAYEENPALEERLKRIVPLGRIGDPHDDVAPAVIFLLSDCARYITGQTLVVDGGRFMGL